ncbi:MAG TPA: sulfatase-like hydrolase/transferase, partial [Verrucomicrobiae bacterium]|nr:sulfatase-like hydrolase/transferase [Verrucomicrobiae bacterium]
KLDQSGLLDNTVVVFYGDHEGVHKFYQDEVDQVKPSQDWWLNNHAEVPLIIYQKGLKGEEITTIGGEIDILPTVSYLMGIDDDAVAGTAMGRNLLKTNKNYAILGNGQPTGRIYSAEESQNLTKGIEFADKIIQSNFFKDLESK